MPDKPGSLGAADPRAQGAEGQVERDEGDEGHGAHGGEQVREDPAVGDQGPQAASRYVTGL